MRVKRTVFVIAGLLLLTAVAWLAVPQFRETAKSMLAQQFPTLRKPLINGQAIPVEERLALAGFKMGQPAHLRVFKQESILEVWVQREKVFELFQTYPICKWSGALGPKLKEGDGQSPEGFYAVSEKQLLPTSKYHLAINTGFPNAYDASLNRTGSVLMIHGSCVSIGCYAMTDAGIDDIYSIVAQALQNGQAEVPVHIFPFRMTVENISAHAGHTWMSFWKNLAEGDAIFQRKRLPPKVFSCGGKYLFEQPIGRCEAVQAW